MPFSPRLSHLLVAAIGTATLFASALPAAAQSNSLDQPIVWRDDFKDDTSGWLVYRKKSALAAPESTAVDYAVGYAKTGYYIYDNQANDTLWSANLPLQKLKLTDESFEVDATKGNGEDASTGYGISCRVAGDFLFSPRETPSSFYALIVTADGQAGLAKVDNNAWSGLVPLASSPAVNTGNATNHLRLDCIGDTITGYVNGQQVVSAQDDSFTTGGIGLWAGTQATPGAGIVYNNAVVRAPVDAASGPAGAQ